MGKKVGITETILRDAHQSLIATRMTTEEILPAVERLDNIGYHSLEAWGGATFDSCLRFLNEDPWEMVNLAEMPAYAFLKNAYKRLLKEEMKKNNDFCNLDDFYWWGKPGMISWDESLKLYVEP